MKHLRLGSYSFIINADALELVVGSPKSFSRNELPDNLKPLFDIIINEYIGKPLYVEFIAISNNVHYSGYLTKSERFNYCLNSGDGTLFQIDAGSEPNKITIDYAKY